MNLLTNNSRFAVSPVAQLNREMNQWMDSLWNQMISDPRAAGPGIPVTTETATPYRVAPVSIWETDTHYHMEFDLPGINPDDLDVKVQENVLTISANRPQKGDVKFVRQERAFGTIERQFSLPTRVDEEGVEATYHAGVLQLLIAKAPEARVRKIEVQST